MKKFLALPFAVALAGCQSATLPAPGPDDPIRVGVLLPLSGNGAHFGEAGRQGIELALDEIDPDGTKFELVWEDTMLTPKGAVTGFRALADWKNAEAILGPLGSSAVTAVAPMTDRAAIPEIAIGGAVTEAIYDHPWFFRIWTTGEKIGREIADEAARRGYKKIAAMTAIDAYSIDVFENFKKFAEENGIEIVQDFRVQPDETDLNSLFARMRFSEPEPDAFFNNGFVGQAGFLTKKARENGISWPIFSNTIHPFPAELEMAGAAAEGIWAPSVPDFSPEFGKKFREKYGSDPENGVVLMGFDAMRALATAFEIAGSRDPVAVRDALADFKFPADAASGATHFDAEGDAVGLRIPIREVRDGELTTISE